MLKRIIILTFFLLFFTATLSTAAEPRQGIITGKWITKAYGPMNGGQVILFNVANGPAPGSNNNSLLRPPDAGVQIDEKGKFSTEVPAGNYYLIMRKRLNPDSAGQTEEGDHWYYARLKDGKPRTYTVKARKTTNIGTITEMAPFRKMKLVTTEGLTGIKGTVIDEQGQPVAGVRVFAYDFPGMLGRPLFASDQTSEDGKYFLNVSQQGTYYLKVRTHYGGGKPLNGELMGTYEKSETQGSVAVEKGEISSGIDIVVSKFVDKRRVQ